MTDIEEKIRAVELEARQKSNQQLLEELRCECPWFLQGVINELERRLVSDAADEIERLRALLRDIADHFGHDYPRWQEIDSVLKGQP